MLNDDDFFMREPQGSRDTQFAPQEGNRMDLLYGYKPKTAEELAEWLVMASMNVVDKDGLRVMYMIPPYAAYQIARMMQIAKLKVPT
jgi:hypothetical protein